MEITQTIFPVAEKIVDKLSLSDIKRILCIYSWKTIDIFGDLDTFYQAFEDKHHDANILESMYNSYDVKKLNSQYYQWWLVGKCGYIKITKEFFGYYFYIMRTRKDLNIFTRMYWATIWSYRKSHRIKFIIDFYHYLWHKKEKDRELIWLFKENKIDRLYIYRSVRNPK